MNITKAWAATLDDYVIDLAWSPPLASEISTEAEGRRSANLKSEIPCRLAAASAAGPVTLFDAATGAVVRKLSGHLDGTNCLAWQPASGVQPSALSSQLLLLATGGQDGRLKLWNAASGALLAEAEISPGAWVEHLAWAPVSGSQPSALSSPLLMAAAGKKLVALRADGSLAHTFKPAPKSISALAWHPRGECAAVAYFGGVCLWDAGTFTAQKEFAYGNAIHALAWSPDARWLVAGTQDNAVHLWAPAEDLELHMSGYETKVKELSFSHDSRWLATGGGRDVCVWDCTGGGPEGRAPLLLPQAARTCAVAFQQKHGLLATASADGVLSLWAPTQKNPLIAEIRLPAPATKFAWRHDDSLLAVGAEQGAIYVFKADV